jgi:hypothetical protein
VVSGGAVLGDLGAQDPRVFVGGMGGPRLRFGSVADGYTALTAGASYLWASREPIGFEPLGVGVRLERYIAFRGMREDNPRSKVGFIVFVQAMRNGEIDNLLAGWNMQF